MKKWGFRYRIIASLASLVVIATAATPTITANDTVDRPAKSTSATKLTAAYASGGELFGGSIAISGDTIVVGAYLDDERGPSAGTPYVYHRSGRSWSQVAKLTCDAAQSITPSPGDTTTPVQPGLLLIIDNLEHIIICNPDTPVADKLEDALAKVQVALKELTKTPPDHAAAMGSIEGTVGDIEAAVEDGLLDPVLGTQLMDQLAGIANQLATGAMDQAIAQGCELTTNSALAGAVEALAEGDALRGLGAFTDAVKRYKEAVANAQSALATC